MLCVGVLLAAAVWGGAKATSTGRKVHYGQHTLDSIPSKPLAEWTRMMGVHHTPATPTEGGVWGLPIPVSLRGVHRGGGALTFSGCGARSGLNNQRQALGVLV
eukprot:Hpha_TRINITY_DN25916_c0_g1::TRINITY_DN25916_c0_g1_i1::g.185402::m.185402